MKSPNEKAGPGGNSLFKNAPRVQLGKITGEAIFELLLNNLHTDEGKPQAFTFQIGVCLNQQHAGSRREASTRLQTACSRLQKVSTIQRISHQTVRIYRLFILSIKYVNVTMCIVHAGWQGEGIQQELTWSE